MDLAGEAAVHIRTGGRGVETVRTEGLVAVAFDHLADGEALVKSAGNARQTRIIANDAG